MKFEWIKMSGEFYSAREDDIMLMAWHNGSFWVWRVEFFTSASFVLLNIQSRMDGVLLGKNDTAEMAKSQAEDAFQKIQEIKRDVDPILQKYRNKWGAPEL